MAWIGWVNGTSEKAGENYTYSEKTDPNIQGAGGLWLRRGMMACFLMVRSMLAQRPLNRKIPVYDVRNKMSKWPYPRECSKCNFAGMCSVYLKQAEIGPSPDFPYNPDLVYSGKHTGWQNLQWEQIYRNYRRIDSMENFYD